MKKLLLLLFTIALLSNLAPGQITYTWIGAADASWAEATNWSPVRTTPDPNDAMLFNDGRTVTITGIPTETIGRLLVASGTRITFQTGAANTLTIGNLTGIDLEVTAGSELNISGTSALTITLATGATGSISGSITFSGGAHRLHATSANPVTFESGAVFTAGSGFSGNAFGNLAAQRNAVVFRNGSTYIQIAGGNPFAQALPHSSVVFQEGSLYRQAGSGGLALSGRTYANFEYDHTGSLSPDGTSPFIINNLTVTRGTLNINMTTDPGHSIRGNINVASGATLNFTPASSGTIRLNGTATQTISGAGTLATNTNSIITILNSAGVILNTTASLHNLTVGLGSVFSINDNQRLTISGTITNDAGTGGLLQRNGSSLQHNTPGVSATVERFFAGTAQWRLVSSPVANQAISGTWTPATPNHGYDFYGWDEPAATWRNQKVAGSPITHFVPGRGYLVSFQAANVTQSFAGPLNNGDVSVTVVRGTQPGFAGANLLGNPYPSAIDWSLAPRTLFADDFAYLYDPTAGGGGGAYITVNGASTGALIAPNQGFFVIKAAAGSATFTFTNALRVHGGTYRSTPANPTLTLTLQKGEFYDRAQVVRQTDATTLRERSDALKFFSLNNMMPQVYTRSADAVQLAVNSTPGFDQAAEFVIGILAPVTGTYTLRVDGLEQILQGRQAFLLDRVTGASHNLVNQPQITFHAMQGGAVDRFVLSFVQPTSIGHERLDATKIYYANGMLHLQFDREDRNRTLQVIDLSGRVVLSKSLQGMGTVVSVPLQVEIGAYIVRITGEGAAVNQRLWVK